MKYSLLLATLFILALKINPIHAQDSHYRVTNPGKFWPAQADLSRHRDKDTPEPKATKPIPLPHGQYVELKAKLHAKRMEHLAAAAESGAIPAARPPLSGSGFSANIPKGTPNDNSVAISNGGYVISVVNTNIRISDTTGKELYNRALASFAGALGPIGHAFDPRVLYDPDADRFIVVFLNQNVSWLNEVIVCFSKTSDPTKGWNLYKLPGNPFNDSTWTDYPIVAITKDELFMTFNLLQDSTDWRDGFTQSIIWQVGKSEGYAGDSLETRLWSGIKHNGSSVWSICPVHGGMSIGGPNMYFLSVRPSAEQNDTLFLHEITNTIRSGQAELKLTVLRSDRPYGVPPNAFQTNGQYLQTNDARVLDAMIEGDRIIYVQNSIDHTKVSPSIYVGRISGVSSGAYTVSADLLSQDTLDFGYPSIAALTSSEQAVTFSHSSRTMHPGTSVYLLENGVPLSWDNGWLIVKDGLAPINVLDDSIERWGDYTGIQRKYNAPGTAWLAGSYGVKRTAFVPINHYTWVAEVRRTESKVTKALEIGRSIVYPNPAKRYVRLDDRGNAVRSILLVDARGVAIPVQGRRVGPEMEVDLEGVAASAYQLIITYDDNSQSTQSLVVE